MIEKDINKRNFREWICSYFWEFISIIYKNSTSFHDNKTWTEMKSLKSAPNRNDLCENEWENILFLIIYLLHAIPGRKVKSELLSVGFFLSFQPLAVWFGLNCYLGPQKSRKNPRIFRGISTNFPRSIKNCFIEINDRFTNGPNLRILRIWNRLWRGSFWFSLRDVFESIKIFTRRFRINWNLLDLTGKNWVGFFIKLTL